MNPLTAEILLAYVPFRVLSETRLEFLLTHCFHLYARKGQILMEPGSDQTHAYFLMSGRVKFEKSSEVLTPAFAYPLHYKSRKQDTVTALTDCSLFQIERDILDRFVCWAQVSNYLEHDIAYQRQFDDQAEWMRTLLRSNLFYKVSPLNIQKIFSHMTSVRVKQGQKIIKQGDIGECCYFVQSGVASVTRVMEDEAKPIFLAEMGVGSCVGEDALLHETVRNATVTMISDGSLVKIEKRDFVQLLREPEVDTLSLPDLDMALQTGAELLDVRTEEEYQFEHLKNALCMPLDLLRVKARMLDAYKLYVVYCDSDRRSRVATYLLEQQGIRARALIGGLNGMPAEQKQNLVEGRRK